MGALEAAETELQKLYRRCRRQTELGAASGSRVSGAVSTARQRLRWWSQSNLYHPRALVIAG
jgi:hypothetical protein